VDVLQMEVDLAEAQNSFEMSLINQQSLENSFKELIGLNISDSVVLSMDMLDYKPVIVDPDKAIELAMKNRLEIRRNVSV
jgi:outer membrane protein TolC